jgi:hypothetical protein
MNRLHSANRLTAYPARVSGSVVVRAFDAREIRGEQALGMDRTTNQSFYGKLIVGCVKARVCSLIYKMGKGRLMAVHCICTQKGLRLLGFHGIESLVRCVEKCSDRIGVLRITGNSYAN